MKLIYKTIVGSQAYGTNIETSDTDYKGIYIQPNKDILTFKYREQQEVGKDETYYEVRRFLQLAASGNPTILEMLFLPIQDALITTKAYSLLYDNRHKFLTKKCKNSFGGYAVQQIQKAKGLDKKMNWEKARVERKTVLDFCYVHEDGKSYPVESWLKEQGKDQKYCGLVGLSHMPDCFALYYDHIQDYLDEGGSSTRLNNAVGHGYHGIVGEDSNSVRTSSVPKYVHPETVMTFNCEGYQLHCKEYREYQKWLGTRNTARYVDVGNHGQKLDGKNLMHCRRLIDCGLEIASMGDLIVRRQNAEYLLSIRRGEVPLEEIIRQAEVDLKLMDQMFQDSALPEDVDWDFVNDLLYEVRTVHRKQEVLYR